MTRRVTRTILNRPIKKQSCHQRKGLLLPKENQSTNGKNKGQEAIIRVSGEISPALSHSHRKAVYVSEETQRKLDFVVRKIGEQGASVSGYVEQVLREHLDQYKDDVEDGGNSEVLHSSNASLR